MSNDWLRVGEGAWLRRFSTEITPEAQAAVLRTFRALQRVKHPAVVNVHPAYTTILVELDPLFATEEEMRAILASLEESDSKERTRRTIEIPVTYGGAFGPDLADVARECDLSVEKVVALHSGAVYEVAFLGFQPGFAYLAGLPEELRTTRLSIPRPRVPAGSVGIAGSQAGVYPFATPGGWRLLGKTPLTLFAADRESPSLLQLGDRVRFRPITAEEPP